MKTQSRLSTLPFATSSTSVIAQDSWEQQANFPGAHGYGTDFQGGPRQQVIDIRCGNGLNKVEVCIDSWHHHDRSVCIDNQSVPHLLRNGATLKTCECGPYNPDKASASRIQIIDQIGLVAFSQTIPGEDEVQQLAIEMSATAKGLYVDSDHRESRHENKR